MDDRCESCIHYVFPSKCMNGNCVYTPAYTPIDEFLEEPVHAPEPETVTANASETVETKQKATITVRCCALTKSGKQCKRPAVKGEIFCRKHLK